MLAPSVMSAWETGCTVFPASCSVVHVVCVLLVGLVLRRVELAGNIVLTDWISEFCESIVGAAATGTTELLITT